MLEDQKDRLTHYSLLIFLLLATWRTTLALHAICLTSIQ